MKRATSLFAVLLFALAAGCGGESEPSADPSAAAPSDAAVLAAAGTPSSAGATTLRKGGSIPAFKAVDIRGHEVDLDALIAKEPRLVVAFFFSVKTGREIAVKLNAVERAYGEDKIEIISFGFREDEAALKQFANELGITYYIIDSKELGAEDFLAQIDSVPLTLFVNPDKNRTIVKILRGGGGARAGIIKQIAVNLLEQGDYETARTIAQESIKAGEDSNEAQEVVGFAFASEGKLDEAEAEFGKIGAKAGLARVAYERGDYDKAIGYAKEAGGSGYADTVRGMALQRQGDLEAAAKAFESATSKPGEDWQTSAAANGHGRILHQMGQTEEALSKYNEAIELSPYNVIALSNEGAVHRERGDLDAAAAALEKAQAWGGTNDEFVSTMLRQVVEEKAKANDLKRREMIQKQIADLGERYKKLQKEGRAEPEDPWSTRPQILAFLPSSSTQSVFFQRAGLDVVIRREIEARISRDDRVRVVEREVIDQLLQELNLGSSDLADKNTQLQLGKVLSARMLGFIDFASVGQDNVMYTRLADTETTELTNLSPQNLRNESNFGEIVQKVVDEIISRVVEDRQIQGLIADVPDDDNIMINIGRIHGVRAGQEFLIIKEGDPIEVGGRVIAHKMVKVGALEVTQVEDDYAVGKLTSKKDGVKIKPEMKIKEARKK